MASEDDLLVAEYIWDQSRKISNHWFRLPRFADILHVSRGCGCPKKYIYPRYYSPSHRHGICYRHYFTAFLPDIDMARRGPVPFHLHEVRSNRVETRRYPNQYTLRELCVLTIKINSKKV